MLRWIATLCGPRCGLLQFHSLCWHLFTWWIFLLWSIKSYDLIRTNNICLALQISQLLYQNLIFSLLPQLFLIFLNLSCIFIWQNNNYLIFSQRCLSALILKNRTFSFRYLLLWNFILFLWFFVILITLFFNFLIGNMFYFACHSCFISKLGQSLF